jgi:hypothetical protein
MDFGECSNAFIASARIGYLKDDFKLDRHAEGKAGHADH